MFDLLENAVEKGRNLGASYVELRGESGFIEYIQMDDLRVNALTQRIEKGVAIRTLVDGAWGFVSTGNLDSIDNAVENSVKMAKAAAPTRKKPIELAETKAIEDDDERKVVRDPYHVPIEEKLKYMENMTKFITNYDARIKAITIKVRTASINKFLLTSDGTRIKSNSILVWVFPWVTGKEGTKLSAARYEDASTHQGWEYMEHVATPEAIGSAVGKRVKLQLEGIPAKAGSFPCVIGPRVIGVLAHEALGHLAEADLTIHSSFNGKVGEKVAAEGVNMTDDGTYPGNLGTSKYDDEGTPSSKVTIIKDSILSELMTNREYAKKINQRSTGNSRAESYLYPPIIRMRNTFFEHGDYQPEELLENIKFGYYCADFRAGQAQMNASFQVGIQEAYEIINGEISRPVTDLSISGIATDSLFKIDAVSRENFPFELGRCGKGAQEVFVASGGPNIRFREGGITFGGKE